MRNRGQTLVLFSVTMLLLVVMVGVSLTIGMRAREKMELQTMADAAAYSNAIVTARAYNQVAVWNRAQIAHMMTLAGVQSHISYAGWYVALLKGSEYGGYATASLAGLICAGCPFGCGFCCACCKTVKVAIDFAKAFSKEYDKAKKQLEKIDSQMARQARFIQDAAAMYGTAGQKLYQFHTFSQRTGGLADAVQDLVKARAANPGEYKVDVITSALVSAKELGEACIAAVDGQCILGTSKDTSGQVPAMEITNGTRESEFLRSRGWMATPPDPPVIAMKKKSITAFFATGTGHFGSGKHSPLAVGDNQAWGDDDGFAAGIINLPSACPLPTGWKASSEVKSSAQQFPSHHRMSPGGPAKAGQDEDTTHDLRKCEDKQGRPCNSVWVGRQEFNIAHDNAQKLRDGKQGGADKQWMQPVNMVKLERNYGARSKRDPWEFKFRMQVSAGGGQDVDLKPPSRDAQVALATAITYYHRNMQNAAQSCDEPPNFFNPYWRATLVPADIDGQTNLGLATFSTPSALLLKNAGFKGIQ